MHMHAHEVRVRVVATHCRVVPVDLVAQIVRPVAAAIPAPINNDNDNDDNIITIMTMMQ